MAEVLGICIIMESFNWCLRGPQYEQAQFRVSPPLAALRLSCV